MLLARHQSGDISTHHASGSHSRGSSERSDHGDHWYLQVLQCRIALALSLSLRMLVLSPKYGSKSKGSAPEAGSGQPDSDEALL